MKSHQFPSLQSALDYCTSKGTLEYFGREGKQSEIYIYTLHIGQTQYFLSIYEDGLVQVRDVKGVRR